MKRKEGNVLEIFLQNTSNLAQEAWKEEKKVKYF